MKKISFLFCFLLLQAACVSLPPYVSQKTPQQIVYLFMSTYGTSRISQLAPYTTEYFRNYIPEELWVIKTWEILKELDYRHLRGKIVKEVVKKDNAVIVALSAVETIAGKTSQKETYCFVKTRDGWKLDELLIEEENIELKKYNERDFSEACFVSTMKGKV